MSVELRLDLTVGMDAGAAWGILDQYAGAIHGRLVSTSLNDEEKMTLRIAEEEGKRRAKTLFLTLGDLHGLFRPEGQDPVG